MAAVEVSFALRSAFLRMSDALIHPCFGVGFDPGSASFKLQPRYTWVDRCASSRICACVRLGGGRGALIRTETAVLPPVRSRRSGGYALRRIPCFPCPGSSTLIRESRPTGARPARVTCGQFHRSGGGRYVPASDPPRGAPIRV